MQVSTYARNNKRYVAYWLGPRIDKHFVKLYGKRKAFHKGGNSSCHLHIRQHYNLYKERCEKADIPTSHWAIPRDIWRIMEEEKEVEEQGLISNKGKQQLLDFKTVTVLHEFTRANVLQAVANLIATNNQVSC